MNGVVTTARGDRGRALAGAIALAVASAVAGIGLAAVSTMFGDLAPVVLVGLPVLAAVITAALSRPRIAIYAILATFPFGAISLPTGFANFEAVEISVLAFGLVVVLSRLASGKTPLAWVPELWWIVGLIGWTLLALVSALDQQLAIKQIAQLVGGLFFACVLIASCENERDIRKILTAFLLVAVAISVVTIAASGTAAARFGGAVVEGRARGTFSQPNELGLFAAMATVVAAGLALSTATWRARAGPVVAFGVTVAAMLLSLSRGGWIGAGCAAAFLALTLKDERRTIVAVAAPLIVVAIAVGAYAPRSPQVQIIGQRLESFTVLSPYDDRPAIYQEALREMRADPWTGQGPGSFPVASARAASEASTAAADHAHNLWLTWGAESGIPAALLITAFIVHLGISSARTIRERSGKQRTLVLSLAAALVVVLAQGMVDYPLRNAVIFYSVWTMIGVLLATRKIASSPSAMGTVD